MWVSDATASIRSLLVKKAQGRLSKEKLGAILGIDGSQAGRFLNGETRPDLSKVMLTLEALKLPKAHFFRMALAAELYGPAEVLTCYGEDPKAELAPFLLHYEALVSILEPLPAEAQPSPRRAELLELEDRRFSDPLGAKARLEELACGWLALCEHELPPRELIGDIAIALATWASVMRLRSQRDDALKALQLAFRLGLRCREPWVIGVLYQKAAYLLMDLSDVATGLEFLGEALKHFTLSRDTEWQAKVYVDYGVLYHFAGRDEEAIPWLELAIDELPRSSQRHRFAAHHNLAIACAALERYPAAAAAMGRALELRPAYPRAEASLRWVEAALQLAAGEVAKAIQSYRRARNIYLECENWVECAFVTVDLAKALLRSKDKEGLAELGGETAVLAKRLRKHQATNDLLLSFAVECRRGSVAEPLLEALAETLEKAFPDRLVHLDQN